MKKNIALATLLCFCILSANILISTESHASNFRFLRNSVLTRFTEIETQEFKTFVAQSLDKANDQQVLSWSSKHSDMKGRLKVDFSYESGDILCRRSLFIIKDNKGQAERFQFEICKQDGAWSIHDTAARHFQESDWKIQREYGLQALQQQQQGVPFSWHNAKTGNSGVITSIASEARDKGECRKVALTIFNKNGQSSNGVYWMCHGGDGNWQREIRDTMDNNHSANTSAP